MYIVVLFVVSDDGTITINVILVGSVMSSVNNFCVLREALKVGKAILNWFGHSSFWQETTYISHLEVWEFMKLKLW